MAEELDVLAKGLRLAYNFVRDIAVATSSEERLPVDVHTPRPPPDFEDHSDEVTEVDVTEVVNDGLDDPVIVDMSLVHNLVLVSRHQPGGERRDMKLINLID